jgi:hypothetical protein
LVSAGRERESKVESDPDPDLQRAKDLVDLHGNVKVRLEERGLDGELEELRERVEKMVREVGRR